MSGWSSSASGSAPSHEPAPPVGATVPVGPEPVRRPAFLTPAARKAIRHRMLRVREASLERAATLAGVEAAELRGFRHELSDGEVSDALLSRGANLAFAQELPQGALLYLLVRGLRPQRVVETGVRPGYSTAWILAALQANDFGELFSIGPGSPEGRVRGVGGVTVGQMVPPSWRARWTLVLGNSEARLQEVLRSTGATDLFFYDNGPDPSRARMEFRTAWAALSPRGVLLAHRAESNPAWAEFCRGQSLPAQILDPGPPALGGLGIRTIEVGRRGA